MRYTWLALIAALRIATGQDATSLSLKGQIDLPNVNGRIDHFSADLKNHRLFMSALGNHTGEVRNRVEAFAALYIQYLDRVVAKGGHE